MLDERKEQAITFLLTGAGPTDVSKKVGVSRTTIYEWLKNDEFKSEFDVRHQEIVNKGNAYVLGNVQSHLEVLHDLAISTTDKRTAAQCAMYLVDRALGKVPNKIENVAEDKDTLDDGQLERELKEFDRIQKEEEEIRKMKLAR